ncbi:MAG: small subunit ribosomal protein [Candidatus Atribacteria bacterium]|nr:small subunit ribosomal protein [Candidatus Atribacteria bacterium]
MTEIKVGQGENIDDALRRFKRKCQRSGLTSEIKRRKFYEKPSERKRRKAARRRRRKF